MALWLPQRRDVVSFAGVFGLLGAVYLLPPDTSLRQVRAAGTLRVCVPPSYPPLITGDPAAPGIDIELLQAIAQQLGVRLATVENPVMGRDFNPRDWRITRAQCEVLAGGVVGSATTRGFLETTPAYAETGWAWLSPHPDVTLSGVTLHPDMAPHPDITPHPGVTPHPDMAPHPGVTLQGRRVGVLVGVSGLDRVALAAWLRAAKAQVTVTLDSAELLAGLEDGRFEAGITERLLAEKLASPRGWPVGWMPPELPRYPVVLGLWKGDLTLKRAIVSALAQMRRSGRLAAIIARYVPGGSPAAQDEAPEDGLGRRK